MTKDDTLEPARPDLNKIECTHCKYKGTLEWEGRVYNIPGAPCCEKYPKESGGKPDGIIHPIYDVSKHEFYWEGHYIKCPYFEKDE